MKRYLTLALLLVSALQPRGAQGTVSTDPNAYDGFNYEDGPLAGLLSRAVVVVDAAGAVVYTQQVPEIGAEPDYASALAAARAAMGK